MKKQQVIETFVTQEFEKSEHIHTKKGRVYSIPTFGNTLTSIDVIGVKPKEPVYIGTQKLEFRVLRTYLYMKSTSGDFIQLSFGRFLKGRTIKEMYLKNTPIYIRYEGKKKHLFQKLTPKRGKVVLSTIGNLEMRSQKNRVKRYIDILD